MTGVDNVCERAAVLAAGGTIILPKQAGNGVTINVVEAIGKRLAACHREVMGIA